MLEELKMRTSFNISRTFNPFMTEAVITQKPVHGFYMITASIMRGLHTQHLFRTKTAEKRASSRHQSKNKYSHALSLAQSTENKFNISGGKLHTSPVINSNPENVSLVGLGFLSLITCGMNTKDKIKTITKIFKYNNQRRKVKYDSTPVPNRPVREKSFCKWSF